MSSQRMFELVNFLHYELATDECKNLPFAGKQIILIGEFLSCNLYQMSSMKATSCFMHHSLTLLLLIVSD